jgi:anti-sigma regulatory factor (Ser/Thr protein kinase)
MMASTALHALLNQMGEPVMNERASARQDELGLRDAPGSWPRQSYLELGVTASAAPCARGHTRLVLAEWGLPELADPAEQVVSELTTNAVAASYGLVGSRFGGRWSAGLPPVRLWLMAHSRRVLVQVWDGNNRMPQQREADAEAESGRGLWLVEALSEDWGAFQPEHASGKVVWALVASP